MKRIKRHKVKTEAPESSTSHNKEQEVHDLAYYIHDRVELMHQVFSVIKYKELKAMVPGCIRNISLDDLQELCTEELLGISSKRLCAILDGADPPSDTESSSPSPPPEQMETISLDSISSDEEILSQASGKKKKQKHRRHSKSKAKRRKSSEENQDDRNDRSKASRAGLTVLELLELQARARAIRAQLQQEQQNKPTAETLTEPPQSSDNEVEIKEEPAEVVEISSDDEKPALEDLHSKLTAAQEPALTQPTTSQTTVTKRINDLVITVPQKSKQKIKLKRNKSVTTAPEKNSVTTAEKPKDTPSIANKQNTKNIPAATETKVDDKTTKKDKPKRKKKDKKNVTKDDIDNDEITLQLSDTEKMDLLEDLDRKHYDSVSSESSSGSSSDSDATENGKDSLKEKEAVTPEKDKQNKSAAVKVGLEAEKVSLGADEVVLVTEEVTLRVDKESDSDINKQKEDPKDSSEILTEDSHKNSSEIDLIEDSQEKITVHDKTVQEKPDSEIIEGESEILEKTDSNTTVKDTVETVDVAENPDITMKDTSAVIKDKSSEEVKANEKNMSEGELSDRESSDVEAVDLKPEVVCISDEEGSKKAKKKKKKKDKKSKKEKKSKKKSDFRESTDQNFYKDGNSVQQETETQDSVEIIDNSSQEEVKSQDSLVTINHSSQSDTLSQDSSINKTMDTVSTESTDKVDFPTTKDTVLQVLTDIVDRVAITSKNTIDEDEEPLKEKKPIDKTDNESPGALSDSDIEAVYEIMELSDDSSCCEVECTTILSKEPTASEIEALSAKIDEIERVDIITDKEIRDYEREQEKEKEFEMISNISWKDRYLDSTKVKKVLTTANIFNALRKKNIELKKKLAESKTETEETVNEVEPQKNLEEGSIELYNTLEPLTSYVNPVKEVTKDLKKDAKLLLKMYKKLLKYNDMNKPKDPNKKRKKKKRDKKVKKELKEVIETESGENVVNTDIGEVRVEIGQKLQNKEIES